MASSVSSFMITNRDWAVGLSTAHPIKDGGLMWFSAQGPCITDSKKFSPDSQDSSTQPSSNYTDAMVAQLQAMPDPSLTLFIHGLDCSWESAVSFTGHLGISLAAQGYQGLVIGYSWPSAGEADLFSYSNGYPPQASTHTVRGKMAYGAPSVANLMTWLATLQSRVDGLSVNLLCHSEGNYALMYSLTQTAASGLDQIVMLAADVNDGAFLPDDDVHTGQGAAIVAAATQITVYFTRSDYILGISMAVFGAPFPVIDHIDSGAYHNPTFAGRLGLSGPAYSAGAQSEKMVSVDCSAVLNDTALTDYGITGIGIHTAYFAVPQVQADIAAVLQGQPACSIQAREALSNTGAYAMTLVSG